MEFQIPILPFSFSLFSAFLRGHYPEQVHRVNSQLRAESGLWLPWPIQIVFANFIMLHLSRQDFFRFNVKQLIC
jgi:hypothetical protein